MNIRKLEWDSNFFGLRIGRADVETMEDVQKLVFMHDSLHERFDLIYIFDEHQVGVSISGAKLMDEKVEYVKSIECKSQSEEVMRFVGNQPTEKMYDIALQSGWKSRFKKDSLLPKDAFERLYRCWIERSVGDDHPMADYVLIYNYPDGIAHGLLTLKLKPESGEASIGLVAVDTAYRNNGIGTKLISTAEGGLWGCYDKLYVDTQLSNYQACTYYERNGFHKNKEINIYHWWL